MNFKSLFDSMVVLYGEPDAGAVVCDSGVNATDQCAFENMNARHRDGGLLSDAQLAWLRDMAERYA